MQEASNRVREGEGVTGNRIHPGDGTTLPSNALTDDQPSKHTTEDQRAGDGYTGHSGEIQKELEVLKKEAQAEKEQSP